MKEALAGKNILITGGAGSVGNALTEEILKHGPKTIRIFDLSENEMFKIKNQYGKERNVRFLIGDIRDINRLKMAMEGVRIWNTCLKRSIQYDRLIPLLLPMKAT